MLGHDLVALRRPEVTGKDIEDSDITSGPDCRELVEENSRSVCNAAHSRMWTECETEVERLIRSTPEGSGYRPGCKGKTFARPFLD